MIRAALLAATLLTFAAHAAPPAANTLEQDARLFGARELLRDVALSPDGQKISFLTPIKASAPR